ncbi:MAG: hypothetical protein ACLQRH_22420 [Acidimicrobiales bacterium]
MAAVVVVTALAIGATVVAVTALVLGATVVAGPGAGVVVVLVVVVVAAEADAWWLSEVFLAADGLDEPHAAVISAAAARTAATLTSPRA